MDHAYEFPPGSPIDPAHAQLAEWRTLHDDYDPLHDAARDQRLRCCYLACLSRVTPVHRSGELDPPQRCFTHVEPASISPPCPYRVDRYGHTHEHRLRKVVENDVRIQIESKLGAGRSFIVSDYHEHEPLIRISGVDAPLRIRILTPGCEKNWSKPFNGTEADEEVLFVVLTSDIPALPTRFIDEQLLQYRPAIVIQPAENEDEKHTWIATPALAKGKKPVWLFDDIDLIRIDYRTLLGLNKPAERFIVPTPYRLAIETIEKQLAGEGLTPAAITILRAFAARLLVEGAGVRETAFGDQQFGARELAVLFEDAELQRICAADPILASIRGEFIAEGLAGLQHTIEALRERAAAAEANLALAREAIADIERKLTAAVADTRLLVTELRSARESLAAAETRRREAEVRTEGLAADLKAAQETLIQERNGRTTLEQAVAEAKTHWLVQLDDLIHHETASRFSH